MEKAANDYLDLQRLLSNAELVPELVRDLALRAPHDLGAWAIERIRIEFTDRAARHGALYSTERTSQPVERRRDRGNRHGLPGPSSRCRRPNQPGNYWGVLSSLCVSLTRACANVLYGSSRTAC